MNFDTDTVKPKFTRRPLIASNSEAIVILETAIMQDTRDGQVGIIEGTVLEAVSGNVRAGEKLKLVYEPLEDKAKIFKNQDGTKRNYGLERFRAALETCNGGDLGNDASIKEFMRNCAGVLVRVVSKDAVSKKGQSYVERKLISVPNQTAETIAKNRTTLGLK